MHREDVGVYGTATSMKMLPVLPFWPAGTLCEYVGGWVLGLPVVLSCPFGPCALMGSSLAACTRMRYLCVSLSGVRHGTLPAWCGASR